MTKPADLGARAIVACDDPALLWTLSVALDELGFAIEAARLNEVVERARRCPWALLMIDAAADDPTTAVLAELSEMPVAPATVLLCAGSLERTIARQFGVAALRKPFTTSGLVSTVLRAGAMRRRPRARSACRLSLG